MILPCWCWFVGPCLWSHDRGYNWCVRDLHPTLIRERSLPTITCLRSTLKTVPTVNSALLALTAGPTNQRGHLLLSANKNLDTFNPDVLISSERKWILARVKRRHLVPRWLRLQFLSWILVLSMTRIGLTRVLLVTCVHVGKDFLRCKNPLGKMQCVQLWTRMVFPVHVLIMWMSSCRIMWILTLVMPCSFLIKPQICFL